MGWIKLVLVFSFNQKPKEKKIEKELRNCMNEHLLLLLYTLHTYQHTCLLLLLVLHISSSFPYLFCCCFSPHLEIKGSGNFKACVLHFHLTYNQTLKWRINIIQNSEGYKKNHTQTDGLLLWTLLYCIHLISFLFFHDKKTQRRIFSNKIQYLSMNSNTSHLYHHLTLFFLPKKTSL